MKCFFFLPDLWPEVEAVQEQSGGYRRRSDPGHQQALQATRRGRGDQDRAGRAEQTVHLSDSVDQGQTPGDHSQTLRGQCEYSGRTKTLSINCVHSG